MSQNTIYGAIPSTIREQKYVSLKTYRKNGAPIATPVWFGEEDGKLYVMTISSSGKCKRIRNNPRVSVAPCSFRGAIKGPESPAVARLLPVEYHAFARKTITRKYFLARISSPWSKADAFIEISFEEGTA
ncbi:MAG TPA: PPOX class F420-dependent oxidoreductase [Candidatus Sulfotelmatobacter sp.]